MYKGSTIDLSSLLLVSLHFLQASAESNFDPTRHLGGNGPWYQGIYTVLVAHNGEHKLISWQVRMFSTFLTKLQKAAL